MLLIVKSIGTLIWRGVSSTPIIASAASSQRIVYRATSRAPLPSALAVSNCGVVIGQKTMS